MKLIYKEASRKMLKLGIASLSLFVMIVALGCFVTGFSIFMIISLGIDFCVAIFDFVQAVRYWQKAKECE